MKKIGNDINILIDGEFPMYARSSSWESKTEFQKVNTASTGKWEENIPKRKSWSMQIDCLFCKGIGSKLWQAYHEDKKIFAKWIDEDGIGWAGWAYIKTCQAGAPINGMATFKVTLLGTGELNKIYENQCGSFIVSGVDYDHVNIKIYFDIDLEKVTEGEVAICYQNPNGEVQEVWQGHGNTQSDGVEFQLLQPLDQGEEENLIDTLKQRLFTRTDSDSICTLNF